MSSGPQSSLAPVASVVMHRLSGFAALLREHGIRVGAPEVIAAVEVLGTLDLSEPDSLYWGTRMTMVRRVDDLPLFDLLFEQYWQRLLDPKQLRHYEQPGAEEEQARPDGVGEEPDHARELSRSLPAHDEAGEEGEEEPELGAWSEVEVLRRTDFADYTEEDYRRLRELLEEFDLAGPWRLSRRKRRHRKGSLDVRGTMLSGFRTGGHPMRRLYRRPRRKPRSLTFVCDVSGSMERYSKAVLQLAHVAIGRRRHVEAFAFATRLTRLTRELLSGNPEASVKAAAAKVVDWSGGTRVGACLQELHQSHPSAVRGAVVVIASDGWDLGDPAELSAQAELLHRMANTVIWVNPHLQDPAFEPITRGMSAALPHVDQFISCHNFDSFTALVKLLEEL